MNLSTIICTFQVNLDYSVVFLQFFHNRASGNKWHGFFIGWMPILSTTFGEKALKEIPGNLRKIAVLFVIIFSVLCC